MPRPTDAAVRKDFRLAAVTAAVAASVFAIVGGVSAAVVLPDNMLSSGPTQFQPPAFEPLPVAAAPATTPVASAAPGHDGHEPAPVAEDPNAPLVVEVRMGEYSFTPKRITAPVGRTIRFEVSNPGIAPHEFLIGDKHTQDDAEVEMAKGAPSPTGGGHRHGNSASVYLNPGETGVLEATFDQPGELLIGCHVPGHWDAGMKGTFTVTS